MKKIQLIISLCLVGLVSVNAQEKKIKFSKGTLKICSKKNFQISGYDGDEVIIKTLHDKDQAKAYSYVVNGYKTSVASSSAQTIKGLGKISNDKNDKVINGRVAFVSNNDVKRKQGLKKLGKNLDNEDLGIFFTIEKSGNELIFKDKTNNGLIMVSGEEYEVKIPNSISINWLSGDCTPNTKKADNK